MKYYCKYIDDCIGLPGGCHSGCAEYEPDLKNKIGKIVNRDCFWMLEEPDYNAYKTSCAKMFRLEEGTPEENKFKYCPYCGKEIITEADKDHQAASLCFY